MQAMSWRPRVDKGFSTGKDAEMAKSDTSYTGIFEPMTTMGTLFTNPVMGPQAQHFWEAQDRMLAEMEKFSSGWFKRRHEAAQSAMRASQKVAAEGVTDPGAAMKAMTDWQAGSMERLAEDAKNCMEMMTRCAGTVASNEAEAVDETVETAKKSSKTSKSQPV